MDENARNGIKVAFRVWDPFSSSSSPASSSASSPSASESENRKRFMKKGVNGNNATFVTAAVNWTQG